MQELTSNGSLQNLFREALGVMESAFRTLEKKVPQPQKKKSRHLFVYRYAEETIHQALILKLARAISGLYAIDALLIHGHLQEQAAIQRILEDINEDILFLADAITNGQTELHKRFLAAFWGEILTDTEKASDRLKKPDVPRRKNIRAHIHRDLPNPSKASDVGKNIHSAYSAYVHASAPVIMDMYGGLPPRFHISGMLGTPKIQEYMADARNYFYRGIASVVFVARAFGDEDLANEVHKYSERFFHDSGLAVRGR